MGKKKTQSQQLQRAAEVEDAIADNSNAFNNRLSQKQIEEKVNRIHDIFGDWAKVDIRRALEENEYDDDLVINNHLTGVDKWQEVKKKDKPKEPIRPKNRRTPSGTQPIDRGDKGTIQRGGRGGGRGAKGTTRTDRKTADITTEATVKEFNTKDQVTTDESSDIVPVTRTFKSYSEAAAVSAQEPAVPEPVVIKKKETTKREKIQQTRQQQQQPQQQQPKLQYIKPEHRTQTVISPPGSSISQQNNSPSRTQYVSRGNELTNTVNESLTQPSPKKGHKTVSPPQDRNPDSTVIMPKVDFNTVNVQFGSLGINDHAEQQPQTTVTVQTRTENKDSVQTSNLGAQEQAQSQDNASADYYGQTSGWGPNEGQFQTEQYSGEESVSHDQSLGQLQQPPFQQSNLYSFQQPQQQRTGEKGSTQTQPQRTSPNLPYGKPYAPNHPYGAMPNIHSSAQTPYQYPTYPSYPHPYMMPNQFQYHSYPQMGPNAKFSQQFYPKNSYVYPGVPTGAHLPSSGAPTSEDPSHLDYSKQQHFDMSNIGAQHYFYMQQQHQQAQQQSVNQEGAKSGLKGKDNRPPNEQPTTGVDLQQQQQQQFSHYQYMQPNMYNQYSYMFQPPVHQYPTPQQPTQQISQAGGKSSRDQQQQSSLNSTAWQ